MKLDQDRTGTVIAANPDDTYDVRLDQANSPVLPRVPNLSRVQLKVPDRVYLSPAYGRPYNYYILGPMGTSGGQARGRGTTVRVVFPDGSRVVGAVVTIMDDEGVQRFRRPTNALGQVLFVTTSGGTFDIQVTKDGVSAYANSVELPQTLVEITILPKSVP